jgi:2-iminobutanoate/2-iminopropanoate deaminase
MPNATVSTPGAPRAIGPYSQGIKANGFLFTAGQVGFDPESGELVDGGIAEQTLRVLQNLRAILRAGGSDLSAVVKTTVFLVDMADFALMNEVYAEIFGDHRPARSTVAVASLPRGARVEIEAIAALPEIRCGSGSGLVVWPVFKTAWWPGKRPDLSGERRAGSWA